MGERSPKPEYRSPKEARNPKSERAIRGHDPQSVAQAGRLQRPCSLWCHGREPAAVFGLRASDFFRVSGFGFVAPIPPEAVIRYMSPRPGIAAPAFVLLQELALELHAFFVCREALAHPADRLQRFIELAGAIEVEGISVAVLRVIRA
jgi:hypothetical protein